MRCLLLAAAMLCGVCGICAAADPVPPAGFWKLTLPTGRDQEVILMLSFTEQDGKWVGDYLSSSEKLKEEFKFKALKVNGDVVQFVLDVKGQEIISFDGLLSKDKKKIAGSVSLQGSRLMLMDLYPTKLKNLEDSVEVARESLTQMETGPELFNAAFEVVDKAAAKKIPVEEVARIVDRVNKAAAGYGPRWEREMTLKLAEALAGQNGFGDVALAQAKRAERLLSDDDPASVRMTVLQAIAKSLTSSGKREEAKPYLAQIAKLESRDYAEYAKTFPFKTEPFAGRKGKSDRAVLVEVFTGAECPPCVAADLAFDGLLKTYKPTDVICLQYHEHIPRPDPLTSPDSEKRMAETYREQVEGTPTLFIGGIVGPPCGGPAAAAQGTYAAFRKAIDESLEKPAAVKLGLSIGKGEKGSYSAKATVSDLQAPGEKVMLRFALAEELVRYPGGNGLRYHHMVVRAMPGGTKGFPLTKKSTEQVVSFNPDEVREVLNQYLTNFTKEEASFPRPDRPLSLKNLKLVAFVQNDATHEVLQAVQVDVDAK